jgi:cellulose biosynthesis protein BcsQ
MIREQLTAALAAQRAAESNANELRAEYERVIAEFDRANEKVKEQETVLEAHHQRIKSVREHKGRFWQAPLLAKPPEFVPLAKRRTRIISVLNLKGGVGKTTLTANLGGYLANCHEKWVLLLDLDHQRSLTQLLLSSERRKRAALARQTVQDFLLSARGGRDLYAATLEVPGASQRLSLVGNSDAEPGFGTLQNLDDLEMSLLGKWLVDPAEEDVRYLMRPALHSDVTQNRFDYVLIDCPPRLTTACINALAASDFVLIPTELEQVSARSVPHLLRRLRELREQGILPDIKILGIVANKVSVTPGPKVGEENVLLKTAGLAHDAWQSSVRILKSRLRDSGQYANCQRELETKLRIPAVVIQDIREQYSQLVTEIEGQIDDSLRVAGVPS